MTYMRVPLTGSPRLEGDAQRSPCTVSKGLGKGRGSGRFHEAVFPRLYVAGLPLSHVQTKRHMRAVFCGLYLAGWG